MTYRLVINDTNAAQLIPWMKDGGVLVWHSLDLGNLEQQWITPHDAIEKPHWRACSLPEAELIRDAKEVAVVILEEVYRFPVDLRQSGNGLAMKLTDESNEAVNRAILAKERTQWASYRFDYETQECVILDSTAEPHSLQYLMDIGDLIGLPE